MNDITESGEFKPVQKGEKMYDPNHGVDFGSQKMYLTIGNSANYTIIIPKDATEVENFAANELSEFVYKSSGARLKIRTDDEINYNINTEYISIGKTSLLSSSKLDVYYSKLNREGFAIKTKGKLIFLDGATGRGTLYAVYDFLEKFVGIKFLTEDSTYIPKNQDIYVHSLDIIEVPYFTNRTFSAANIQQNTYFAAQSRLSDIWAITPAKYGGGYYDDAYQPNDHSFFGLMPPLVYGKDHPSWYSMGSIHNEGAYSQLCLTNEEMTLEAIVN